MPKVKKTAKKKSLPKKKAKDKKSVPNDHFVVSSKSYEYQLCYF